MQTSQIPGGIQPWSKGSLFPAVIARISRYQDTVVAVCAGTPIHRLVETNSWELTLGDFCEEYATREDAEQAARGLLDGVEAGSISAREAVSDEFYWQREALAANGSEC